MNSIPYERKKTFFFDGTLNFSAKLKPKII